MVGAEASILYSILFASGSMAVCCPRYSVDRYDYRGICKDGSRPGGMYCGYGSCNVFGCACDGGCRKVETVEQCTELLKVCNSGTTE